MVTSKRSTFRGEGRSATMGAFFNLPKINAVLGKQGLSNRYRFTFVNYRTVRVLGTKCKGKDRRKTKGKAKVKSPKKAKGSKKSKAKKASRSKKRKATVKAKPIQVPKRRKISKQLDDQAQKLEANINKLSGELTAMRRNLPKAERERADLGHEHRLLRQQKPAPIWDYRLYGRLKSARVAVADLEQTIREQEKELKKARANLYVTNRAARGFTDKVQEVSKEMAAAKERIKHALHNGSPMNIRGVDPGLVTAATISTLTLQDAYVKVASHASGSTTTNPLRPTKGKRYTARHLHAARLDNAHSANRSRRRARQIDDTKKRSKEKRTREIRGVTYHRKLTSAWREGATITFNGSYRPINSRIKDHRRANLTALGQGIDAPDEDIMVTISEDYSSKTCPVCLSSMKLHKYRREGELKTVNGALRCTNIRCPCHRNSTYGRDDAAAFNIAIRGLSIAISKDNTPLQAFRRNPQDPYQINPNMEIPSV
ncbi:hypothetical protein BJV82DRAFT_290385 [Fennellomyces sp. T-0311]|nr:hypothetical protein BJV82DRAFT_290385 [Fennellomyces sp. T-0311]